jgi:hypothetical protein
MMVNLSKISLKKTKPKATTFGVYIKANMENYGFRANPSVVYIDSMDILLKESTK